MNEEEGTVFIPKMIYWLPQSVRRGAFSLFWQEEYGRLQNKRLTETADGYSYRPFDQNQCIFVHIPKAAGISVCTSLFGNLAGGHTSIGMYQIIFTKEEFDRYFKFTFVRNPWDRLFSAYNFLKKGGVNSNDRRWADSNLSPYTSFNEFVRMWVNKKNVLKYIHFIPQQRFLCPPFMHEPAVDFVGYYENLSTDFSIIQQKVFNGCERSLLYKNKTITEEKLDYKDYYDDETRSIVADVYEDDIRMLGYDFDNSSLNTKLSGRQMP